MMAIDAKIDETEQHFQFVLELQQIIGLLEGSYTLRPEIRPYVVKLERMLKWHYDAYKGNGIPVGKLGFSKPEAKS